MQPRAYDSVHHCDWPEANGPVVDTELLDQMALARQITSLGLGSRGSANIKVRQPLAAALAYVGESETAWNDTYTGIVCEELNVKSLQFVQEVGQLLSYEALPNNKLLGPRLGATLGRVRAALSHTDPAVVAQKVYSGNPVTLNVDGDTYELAPEEVLIRTHPAEGLAVASDRGVTVAVETDITPELRTEGLARELVRRIQVMRRDAGFNIADRIVTYGVAQGPLADALLAWGDYVKSETLSTELVSGSPPSDAHSEVHRIDGMTITLGVERQTISA